MAIFSRTRDSYEYVLKRQRDEAPEDQTVFILCDLKERDRVRVVDSFAVDENGNPIPGGSGIRIYATLKAGWKGLENARYEDGSNVKFKTEKGSKRVADSMLEMLSWDDKLELAGQILESSHPSEEDTEK